MRRFISWACLFLGGACFGGAFVADTLVSAGVVADPALPFFVLVAALPFFGLAIFVESV